MFEKLLQQDIDEFVKDWNMHPIRKNKLSAGPWGRPNDMYDMPTLYGKTFYYVESCRTQLNL